MPIFYLLKDVLGVSTPDTVAKIGAAAIYVSLCLLTVAGLFFAARTVTGFRLLAVFFMAASLSGILFATYQFASNGLAFNDEIRSSRRESDGVWTLPLTKNEPGRWRRRSAGRRQRI